MPVEVTAALHTTEGPLSLPLQATVTNHPADYPLPQGQIDALAPAPNLTTRMLAKQPADGYELWMDTADPNYTYLLEAPAGTLPTQTTQTLWRGIRLPLNADGKVVGRIAERSTPFAWDSRTTGW